MKFTCEQDQEDFEQEQAINTWLNQTQSNANKLLEKGHITRTGNLKTSLVQAAFSLDAKVRQDDPNCCTFGELIAGSDGRSIENGDDDYHFNEYFNDVIKETLEALSFNEKEIRWLKNLWLHSAMLNEVLSPTSMTDLEWENL